MIWVQKLVDAHEADSIELLFREQAASFDPSNRMLLVSTEEQPPMKRLWVALADFDLLEPYYGFSRCSRRELPPAPILVAGDQTVFERTFHG